MPPKSDFIVLFSTRIIRMFFCGFLSVILALYLAKIGLDEIYIGLLFTLILLGDGVVSLWITASADRIGRRRMLILSAGLMIFAGTVFLGTQNIFFLMVAGIIGFVSPTGNEMGPFLSLEQASLSQIIGAEKRIRIFAWYNLAGSFATALGALCGGWLTYFLQQSGYSPLGSYHVIVGGYILGGFVLALLFLKLSSQIEPLPKTSPSKSFLGLQQSRKPILKLSALFALDAFGGGFVVQSFLAYWFYLRYGVDESWIGNIFFGANLLAGISALLAGRIAEKIGLINTMVFTHIPSNIFLCLVPLMPNFPMAFAMLLLRYSISQMDVPTRQAYTMAIVSPEERSAAAGVTSIARFLGSSLSPLLCGIFLAHPTLVNMPFFVAGILKIIYDLLLYYSFQKSHDSTRFAGDTNERR